MPGPAWANPSLLNRVMSTKTSFAPMAMIHGAAYRGDCVGSAGVPVRQVAGKRHLEGAEYADVEVPAAHHGEGVGVIEVGRAWRLGDRDLAGVDQVRIDVVRRTPADPRPACRSRCARSPRCRGQKVRDPVGWPMPRFTYEPRWDVCGDQPSKIISAERASPTSNRRLQ